MSSVYDTYSHLKCNDPDCTGNVRSEAPFIYECDKCGKRIPYRYVSYRAVASYINPKTGWMFPMIRKE